MDRNRFRIIHSFLPMDAESYLNIGSGSDELARYLTSKGKTVCDIDIKRSPHFHHPKYTFIEGDIMQIDIADFDVVLASHVMEHIQDTGRFLQICRKATKKYFMVIVPPLKHAIVGGHVHVFNMGLLMYNLALSGFDVVNGKFREDGYNLFGIVKPSTVPLPPLANDNGDIQTLVKNNILPQFFHHGIPGNKISQHN